ncbi:MAG: ATP-binding protein [Bdellovibrionota bacterium]
MALLFGVIISQIKLDFIESWLYDVRVRLNNEHSQSGHTELILIQQDTIQRYKRALSFADYMLFLQNISDENPEAILFTFPIEEIEATDEEKQEFNEFIKTQPHVYFASDKLENRGEKDPLRLPPPLNNLQIVSAPRTADLNVLGKDGVTRRMLISYQGSKTFHTKLASVFNPEVADESNIKGTFEFFESQQLYVNFRPSGTFVRTPFENIITKNFDHGKFKGKILMVGFDYNRAAKDYIMTPFSREIVAMTVAEMHANMVETLIENSAPVPLPKWVTIILTLLVSFLTVHVVLTAKPLRGLLVLLSTFVGFSLIALLCFFAFHVWVGMAHPLLTIFLCYYFFIPYRLIVENRRSWEYYQKNKLLRQVEELKSNFISMMSHDLKTPIARIQGMIDVILRDPAPLSTQQHEAVDTIKLSSEDLLKFINSILNYAQIESQGMELHLQSRDVNTLLLEVVKKHEFLGKLKKIQIVTELDPLFPIQVDPELIKQVFSNLIENAIKYSPEDTKILITSEEAENAVVVQISDQGPGVPPDELPNIFMKFFRSKNAKSSPIKGSGLGLYLAMYFTELHKGRLSVESTIGQGSTFTVELPISLGR